MIYFEFMYVLFLKKIQKKQGQTFLFSEFNLFEFESIGCHL